jgi:hypothetical protein
LSQLLDFITAAPARISALFYGFLAVLAVAGVLGSVALWYRAEAIKAEGERDLWKAQAAVVSAAAAACSAGVAESKRVADASVRASGELLEAARRLKQPARHTVERIETIITRQPTVEQAGDCNWAWQVIETDARQKAGAP